MTENSAYDLRMPKTAAFRVVVPRVAALIFMFTIFLTPTLPAQINGVPASVTSIDFGGHHNPTPGIPASVTSLGPNGFHGRSNMFQGQQNVRFFSEPPANRGSRGGGFNGSRHHHRSRFFPGFAPAYAVPYYVPVVTDQAEDQEEERAQDQYLGGPTIFDRRGPGTPRRDQGSDADRADNRAAEPAPAPAAEPVPEPDQPPTQLVFKDGRTLEIQNYAILGDTLYDLTPGHRRRVALTELNLTATVKENDDRGIDFRLPPNTRMD